MVRHTDTTFDESTRKDMRNAEFKTGDVVRITFDPESDIDEVVGEVDVIYTDDKIAVQTDGESPEGKAYLIDGDAQTVKVGNHRDGFESVNARPVYVERPVDDERCVLVFDAPKRLGVGFTTERVEGKRQGDVFIPDDFDGRFRVDVGGDVWFDNTFDRPDEDTETKVGTNSRFES